MGTAQTKGGRAGAAKDVNSRQASKDVPPEARESAAMYAAPHLLTEPPEYNRLSQQPVQLGQGTPPAAACLAPGGQTSGGLQPPAALAVPGYDVGDHQGPLDPNAADARSSSHQSAGSREPASDATREATTGAGTNSAQLQQMTAANNGLGPMPIVPVVFTWTHGGNNVFLIGSFNNWSEKIPMVRSGQEFHVVVNLKREEHQYKFIADDQWRYSSDYPIVSDDLGNIHNVMDVSQYEPYDLFKIPENERLDHPYSQAVPNFADYATEPPTIPIVLAKSAFVAVDPPILKMPPNVPLHCIVSHFYHDFGRTLKGRLRRRVHTAEEQAAVLNATAKANAGGSRETMPTSSKPLHVVSLAVTHRFERQFATTILVTDAGESWPRPIGGREDGWKYHVPCNPLMLAYNFKD